MAKEIIPFKLHDQVGERFPAAVLCQLSLEEEIRVKKSFLGWFAHKSPPYASPEIILMPRPAEM